ncbi:YeiH family protein [Gulosibacter chungangensis]|uniref:Putative sulfate exporter family transporter n=1 Tax=Gulosibacter chungangensis TaxID=979746 RepID=A0A7J5B9W6_9MICO|nr:putative sulfate exporter family transporter [Gulosibacter chungangensis]KAB1642575.1 putative sulfate exporter family transporter [Gulosibacter chungangensis]
MQDRTATTRATRKPHDLCVVRAPQKSIDRAFVRISRKPYNRGFVRAARWVPGLLICATIAAAATVIGTLVPVLGSAIPAVLIGILISLTRSLPRWATPGIRFSSKTVLQLAVVLLGSQLSLASILTVGTESLPVMLTSLAVCLTAAYFIGRALKIERDIRTLIGVGTGICGASAIAAVSPVIHARNSDVSYAISTVFLFNILAVLAFPFIGHALGMSPHAFGLFAGTAVNDTSSVVASTSVFSTAALGFAVTVKLVRTLMIVPVSLTLAVVEARRTAGSERLTFGRAIKLIPWFLVGFLLVAAVTSTGVISPVVQDALGHVSVFLVAMALAGIGLSTDLKAIRSTGFRPLLLGAILSMLVMGSTLGMMALLGYLG